MSRTRIHHFDGFSIKKAGIDIKLDMSRIEGNVNRAQKELDTAVMRSMEPFMPKNKGSFIETTRSQSEAIAGSGEVVAAAGPQGRFLYEGENMVDEKTGSPFARQFAKKVPVSQFRGKTNAKKKLTYSKSANPKARAHWFDAAKEKDHDAWVDVVRKEVGKK